MKKIIVVLVMMMLFTVPAHALDWVYSFVVYDGNVYEVEKNVTLQENEVGSVIGHVQTRPNDMTGTYFGDASNAYEIGTPYYKIDNIAVTESIAIKVGDEYKKANYIHPAPFHLMNVLMNPYFSIGLLLILFIAFASYKTFKQRKEYVTKQM